MTAVTRCDQCGKLDDLAHPAQIDRDRNRVPWPWLRVLDRGEGDGYAYDFCSPACLAKWARRLVREHTQNEARHADH